MAGEALPACEEVAEAPPGGGCVLRASPAAAHGEPLRGEPLHGRCRGFYRLRVGVLRVAYWLDPRECIVRIERLGYRENVYEELGC
ncbi:hypothetical protein [Pyrodictium abyssi]|uniref:type II toxin-antitoxin system RelE family toxin n=1 Tax=Pyrodictium abyssi TaxID=54256 RepID=UPI0030C78469